MSFNTTYNNIEFVLEDGTAILTFNRPDSLNSFNAEMHAEVRAALKEVKKNPDVRALVITGNGRGFCAGQDLSDRNVAPGTEAPNLGESIEKNYNPMIRSIRALEMPVICAVNGVAAGAGANIALACDIVFAAKSAKFIQAFCKIGLIPDSGGTWTLPHSVGQARAMALSMLGDRVSAEDAEKMGMIWKAVEDETVKDTAIATAKELATQPTKGLALIKRAIQASAINTLDQQLDLERDLQTIAGRTDDYREGVAAFMAKRQPSFKGQ
ncbi:2-(1,2-epoxy-1,2-dihydrophenyl)acetyl-CoA isomerase PaaG [Oceanospirillum linum]|uniref:2-(1,2-epoxy-1,2-dihydrophenyl)acetyl-CoA isomerase n=1 Tax=Oceanospirillum linum TaxID=966 RepID=A0A1T1HCT6_OCELI|nr:2-(1,2-epoxy-1,2-dihydrophenyl)acetyl-CoA isomerase PaaG [Oceanospirillum linum]OOV87550.1 2-(1,2-epoxy-1,2-dihydrophenyl)acetyl-CoA isomerase [Oceanospirillum linum]SEF91454.1 2-(1,2-epoxy-1,2-dihydrophenyl)acetyl-CoA isomerase [Oleiphilus messinensis]SMP13094.1 2-(1,2-epoxy-1,2-dihydrophenyl)acetyl-CoA isomerase [Oceanospirillum linum]